MSEPRYLPVLRLGIGAMADVYLGVLSGAARYRKTVVLKRAFANMSADDREARRALVEEAHVAAALHHPNVIHVYELFEADEGLMLAMEYLPGVSVQGLLEHLERTDGEVPWPIAARIVADAARGLSHAHSAVGPDGAPMHIVHQDISPKNVMITEQGITKVLDFGIARSSRRGVDPDRKLMGTLGYLAPEQARAEPLDWRCDVFALGIVLYELLAGRPLYPDRDMDQAVEAAARAIVPPLPDRLPAALRDTVRRMLVRDVSRRRITMTEVADMLEVLVSREAGSHQDVAMLLRAELGEALDRRRERVRAIVEGRATVGRAARSPNETATHALVEKALSTPGTVNIRAPRVDDTWVDDDPEPLPLDEDAPTKVDR